MWFIAGVISRIIMSFDSKKDNVVDLVHMQCLCQVEGGTGGGGSRRGEGA